MIDIHSHILPGLDDGAASLEQAVEMVRIAARCGTTGIVATPHANLRYAFDPAAVAGKIAELREACGVPIEIFGGCDFHLTVENIEDALAHPGRYGINGGRYLLIEFPDFGVPKTTAQILGRFYDKGVAPVVTHPERHPSLRKWMPQLREWVESGCLVQVTAQSLLGRFGSEAAELAADLLRENLVHFIASDAHDHRDRTPALDRAREHVARRYGEARARRLFVDNPRAAVSDAPIDTRAPAKPRRRWWWWGSLGGGA